MDCSIVLDLNSVDDYYKFLKIKSLPVYKFTGREATFPAEYADLIGLKADKERRIEYIPHPLAFDYQRDCTRISLDKEKFALYIKCGYGKSLIYFEFAKAVLKHDPSHGALIVTPNMVVPQMIQEAKKFYGDSLPIERVRSGDVDEWLKTCAGKLGVTNWEAMRNDLHRGQLNCLIGDETDIIKSSYGVYGEEFISLGKGVRFKLSGTGTPAPNDRIEYANQAVFLDRFPNVNSFLAKFFINRGETSERWELKPHALKPFYMALAEFSIFLENPGTYGWKDNCDTIPPIIVHFHDIEMTEEQEVKSEALTGNMFYSVAGGVQQRTKISQIAKGIGGVETNKYAYIKSLVDSWPTESTIIWAWFNPEQDMLEKIFPDAASIQGSTKEEDRIRLLDDFNSGRRKVLISKSRVLGYGLNITIATRHVFSSLIDSYAAYYQCIKRSNRVGSKSPLHVHLPLLEIEKPMVSTVLRKAKMINEDAILQEALFKEKSSCNYAVSHFP